MDDVFRASRPAACSFSLFRARARSEKHENPYRVVRFSGGGVLVFCQLFRSARRAIVAKRARLTAVRLSVLLPSPRTENQPGHVLSRVPVPSDVRPGLERPTNRLHHHQSNTRGTWARTVQINADPVPGGWLIIVGGRGR